MSSVLYVTRLLWNGRLGLAKHAGVMVDLTTWPAAALPGVHVAEMDYTPEVRVYQVRESAHGWRDMTGPEIQAVRAWLQQVADAAKHAVEGEA